MMMDRELVIELIAQTLAPRLFKLSGDNPEEMGFPITDTKEELDTRLARQFDTVNYWLARGREVGTALVNIIEAGGVSVATLDGDAMCRAAAHERPDIGADGTHKSVADLVGGGAKE